MSLKKRQEINQKRNARNAAFNLFLSVLAAGIVLYLLFFVWMKPFRVDGESMNPVIKKGDIVLLDRVAKYVKSPVRGDAVAFINPLTKELMIKRVVALPGETVKIMDGVVCIGGYALDESAYVCNAEKAGNMPAVTVPEGRYFVLSDNRAFGNDSRTFDIDCIPYDDICGIMRFRVYPFDKMNLFY